MAIAVIGDLPGGNAELDQEMLGRLGLRDAPPPGALARLAGPIEGGWRVNEHLGVTGPMGRLSP